MASLTDDNIRTVPVLCNDANSECLVYKELKNGILVVIQNNIKKIAPHFSIIVSRNAHDCTFLTTHKK